MSEPKRLPPAEHLAYIEKRTLETRAFVDETYRHMAAMRDVSPWHPAGGFWPPFALGAGVFAAGMIAGRFPLP